MEYKINGIKVILGLHAKKVGKDRTRIKEIAGVCAIAVLYIMSNYVPNF